MARFTTPARPMTISLGASAEIAGSERLGRVVRVIVDPGDGSVPQLVVGPAAGEAPAGKLVATELITTVGEVVVVSPATQVAELPDYADIELRRLPYGDPTHPGGRVPPEATIWPIEPGDRPWSVEAAQRLRPTDQVAGIPLSKTTEVRSSDGVTVATVAQVVIDDECRLGSVGVETLEDSRLVSLPVEWIRDLSSASIQVTVPRTAVDALPTAK